jgi:hypothetical protein
MNGRICIIVCAMSVAILMAFGLPGCGGKGTKESTANDRKDSVRIVEASSKRDPRLRDLPDGESPITKVDPKSETGGRSLFDGKTLSGWKRTEYGGEGEPKVKDGNLVIPMGATLSGVNYTESTPKMNYEVTLEAMRVDGSDFFCGLTVPIGDSSASLILGGWGGGLCGISSLDGQDAANNETSTVRNFDNKKWYKVRLRVTPGKLEAWINETDKIVDVEIKERKISTRAESDPSRPFGLMTYMTTGAFRNIRLREL